VKLIGVIRSKETSTIEVEANSIHEGREELEAKVPDGYELLLIKTET
jgi:hypothetical protein